MANGSLTFEEFIKLSEDEKCKRYKELSNHDAFLVRLTMPPSLSVEVPCNSCGHYNNDGTCKAFPDGISGDHIENLVNALPSVSKAKYRVGEDDYIPLLGDSDIFCNEKLKIKYKKREDIKDL